jgi:MFS family permease
VLIDPGTARTGRIAISALFLLNGVILGSWAPQIALLLPRHGITESVLGLLILGMGIGSMVAMLLSGRLTARYGSRAMVRATALCCAVTLHLAVIAPDLVTLALAMAAMGASIAMMDVATNANAYELEQATGRAILSSTHGFWSVGGFLGGALGGPGIAALGSEGHALAVGAVALAMVAVSWSSLAGTVAPVEVSAAGSRPGIWRQGWTIYLIGVMALLSFVPESAVLDWSALYLSTDHGASVAVSGLAFALFSACMAAMRFCGDAVRNRVGAVPLLRVSACVAAAGMTLAALAPSTGIALAGFALSGIGLANLVPILFSAAGRQGGANPGAAIAAVSLIGYGGMLIAPTLIGVSAEQVGFPAIFIALSLLLLSVAALAPAVAGTPRRTEFARSEAGA